MNTTDFEKCARRIAAALQLSHSETVLLKLDTRIFTPLIPPLQNGIRTCGAHISGVILAKDVSASSKEELVSLRQLFNDANCFIWFPEFQQGYCPNLAILLKEFVDI